MRRLGIATAAAWLTALVVLLPTAAQAHDSYPFWYAAGWTTTPVKVWLADHDFDAGHVAGTARDAIVNGMVAWNNAPGSRDYSYGGFRYDIAYGAKGTYNVNGVFWAPTGGGTSNDPLGDIRAWVYTADGLVVYFHRFDVRFNSAWKAWNMSAYTAPKFNQADLWSVASHEFGHGMGHWTHWDQGPAASPNLCTPGLAAYHTMCSAIVLGTTQSRSLATHDSHTFTDAYPP